MAQTVLMHPRPDTPATARYVQALSDSLREAGLEVRPLSFRTLLTARRAIVHVHWPEHLFGHPSLPKSLARLVAGVLTIGMAAARSHPLVWTAHNLAPHGPWGVGAATAARWMRRRTDAVVVLCDGQQEELLATFPELEDARLACLPEGQLHEHPPLASESAIGRPVRLLLLGVVIDYKRHLDIIRGLRPHLEAGRVELRIVGRSSVNDYSNRVRDLAASTPGVSYSGDRVPESELIELFGWCDAAIGVQTPVFNSGIPAAVVPLGRRVVLSNGAQSEFLRRRVGHDWISVVEDPASSVEWGSVLQELSRPTPPAVDSALFSWASVAEHQLELYRSVS